MASVFVKYQCYFSIKYYNAMWITNFILYEIMSQDWNSRSKQTQYEFDLKWTVFMFGMCYLCTIHSPLTSCSCYWSNSFSQRKNRWLHSGAGTCRMQCLDTFSLRRPGAICAGLDKHTQWKINKHEWGSQDDLHPPTRHTDTYAHTYVLLI